MKHETLLLRALFALCVTLCVMALTAMLIPRAVNRGHPAMQARAPVTGSALLASNARLCALPADGLTCLRAE